MKLKKPLRFVFICDYMKKEPYVIFDKIVSFDVSDELKDRASQVFDEVIDSYSGKWLYMNGATEVPFDSHEIAFKSANLRFKNEKIKKSLSPANNLNVLADIRQEIFSALVAGFNSKNLPINFSIKDLEFLEPERKEGYIELLYLAAIGREPLGIHKVFVKWLHNGYYSPTCASCQTGVSYFMQGLQSMQNRLFVSKDSRDKSGSKKWVCGDMTFECQSEAGFTYTQVKKISSHQDILDYIVGLNIGAVELSHISHIHLIDEHNNRYETKGTDE